VLALVPYQADVGMSRWPIANFALIPSLVATQLMAMSATDSNAIAPFILQGWSLAEIVGYMFLHGGVFHLVGNMIFLWTFGNAVCAKVGNFTYIPLFLALGVAAATVHNLLDGSPAIGASGAINGIVGMYLVYFPSNNVTCLYWFFFRIGTFYLSGFWIILLFVAFDMWGAFNGSGGVAYWAHLGGFFTGVTLAMLSLLTGLVEMRDSEDSLLKLLGVAD
jgi:membrane associated rhomboid family serine protease